MDYSLLNIVLKNLSQIRSGENTWNSQPEELKKLKLTKVHVEILKELDGEGEQGASGESYETYALPKEFGQGVFLRLQIGTDSYGDNSFVAGIQFVKQVERKIKGYESI